jgi:hypothetical protein
VSTTACRLRRKFTHYLHPDYVGISGLKLETTFGMQLRASFGYSILVDSNQMAHSGLSRFLKFYT